MKYTFTKHTSSSSLTTTTKVEVTATGAVREVVKILDFRLIASWSERNKMTIVPFNKCHDSSLNTKVGQKRLQKVFHGCSVVCTSKAYHTTNAVKIRSFNQSIKCFDKNKLRPCNIREFKFVYNFITDDAANILGISWIDRITNVEVRTKTEQQTMVNILRKRRLRWRGHIIRMDHQRIP